MALMKECKTCNGTGEWHGKKCQVCQGSGEVLAATSDETTALRHKKKPGRRPRGHGKKKK